MARPWYPRYPKDYIADTSHLTMCEDGAYGRLLDQYYLTGEPLPAELERLYRSCRAMTRQERKAIDAVLSQFFERRDGAYRNFRADHEISEANRISEHRAQAGKRGGNAKAIATANAIATATTVHSSQKIPSATHSAGSPSDLWKQVWEQGRAYLVSQGQTEGAARQKLQGWRQKHGELEILRALKIAETNAVEQPIGYIEQILNGKGLKNARQSRDSTDGPLHRLARLAAEAEDVRQARSD